MDRAARVSGANTEPRWPEVPAATERERPGQRREVYRLELRDKEGRTFSFACDEARWRSFQAGQSVVATISGDEVRDVQPPGVER